MRGMAPPVSLLPSSSPSPPCHRVLRRRASLRPLAPPLPRRPLLRRLSDDNNSSSECSPRLRHVRPPAAVSIIAAGDQWGNWAFLLSAAAFGTW
jgi:hypothetical protein